MVDCAHAGTRSKARPRSLEDELVPLAAEVREAVHPFFRMRFLIEYSRALAETSGPEATRPIGAIDEIDRAERARLGAVVEARARAHRRSVLHGARLRWTRRSSAVRTLTPAEGAGFLRRDQRALPRACQEPSRPGFVPHALGHGHDSLTLYDNFVSNGGTRILVYGARSFRILREHWYRAARLFMHAVPCAIPVSLVRLGSPRMSVELPATACPLAEGLAPSTRRRTARALGELLGTLGRSRSRVA